MDLAAANCIMNNIHFLMIKAAATAELCKLNTFPTGLHIVFVPVYAEWKGTIVIGYSADYGAELDVWITQRGNKHTSD